MSERPSSYESCESCGWQLILDEQGQCCACGTRTAKAIEVARKLYADPSNDDIEIDDDPSVHLAQDTDTPLDERGVWVQAWVYVRPDEL